MDSTNGNFTFTCPHCEQRLEAESDMAGMELDCPTCGQTITVPSPTPTPVISVVEKPNLMPVPEMTPVISDKTSSQKSMSKWVGVAVLVVICIVALTKESIGVDKAGKSVVKTDNSEELQKDVQENQKEVSRGKSNSSDKAEQEARALFREAMRYYDGDGVLQNYDKALKLLQVASDKGSIDADAKIAEIYWNGDANKERNKELAVEYALRHGNRRSPDASMILGLASFFGYKTSEGEVEPRLTDAYNYFSAVGSNNIEARFYCGLMQYHGVGTEQSFEDAAETFFSCCKGMSGSDPYAGDAAVCLGYMYYKGEGVAKNDDQAKKWLIWGYKNGCAAFAIAHYARAYPGGMDLFKKALNEYYQPLKGSLAMVRTGMIDFTP